jgi:hypothetical protein
MHRFLVRLPRGDRRVFLSWRLLADDAPDVLIHGRRRAAAGTRPLSDLSAGWINLWDGASVPLCGVGRA